MYLKGEKVKVKESSLKREGMRNLFWRYNLEHSHVFTIFKDTNMKISPGRGGMSYIEFRGYLDGFWNCYSEDLEYAEIIVDYDQDDCDCI